MSGDEICLCLIVCKVGGATGEERQEGGRTAMGFCSAEWSPPTLGLIPLALHHSRPRLTTMSDAPGRFVAKVLGVNSSCRATYLVSYVFNRPYLFRSLASLFLSTAALAKHFVHGHIALTTVWWSPTKKSPTSVQGGPPMPASHGRQVNHMPIYRSAIAFRHEICCDLSQGYYGNLMANERLN
jgi:hypothetical protein